jgi:hypothetical protein
MLPSQAEAMMVDGHPYIPWSRSLGVWKSWLIPEWGPVTVTKTVSSAEEVKGSSGIERLLNLDAVRCGLHA